MTENRLTLTDDLGTDENYKRKGIYRCSCGSVREMFTDNVKSGKSKSCGCLNKEMTSKRVKTHGMSKTSERSIWNSMKQRCYNPKAQSYKSYGARGIKVCDRWLNSFENFLKDMGLKPSPNHSLDRIDNDGDYKPENCRWSDSFVQANNTRKNIFLTAKGQTKTISQWSRDLDIPEPRLYYRYHKGWSHNDILFKTKQNGKYSDL